MAYKDFSLENLEEQFNINNTSSLLFAKDKVRSIQMSDWLKETLELGRHLPIKSEKAKSELIITPILLELKRRNNDFFTFYSGDRLNVDKTKGLNGECDFLLAHNTKSFTINTPIISVVEAKKSDIELGIGQCGAQMLGAKLFNEKRNNGIETVYGCVTTAGEWKFLKLENQLLTIDIETFYYSEVEKVLGVFQEILDFYKPQLSQQ